MQDRRLLRSAIGRPNDNMKRQYEINLCRAYTSFLADRTQVTVELMVWLWSVVVVRPFVRP